VDTSRYRVEPGTKVRLSAHDAGDTDGFRGDKAKGEAALTDLNDRLYELQELLYAEDRHRVLVVLQGMDTSGKDGTVRHVFREMNPVGVRVANFKKPSDDELEHDYLWRIHEHTPRRGEIVIFKRSHYEDVLITRVHGLVPLEVIERRYAHLNDFERMLTDEGTVVLKFFLHISKDEQRARLQARLDNPKKQWKFQHSDVEERQRWDDYVDAYERALTETSTDWAPWYVVPSNHKWYRNLVVANTLISSLESLDMHYPEPAKSLDGIVID
jgi:PPK2 family polyphosphate:nucleotide phosphotransferase